MTARFVGIKAAPFLDVVRHHHLHTTERWVLTCLILEADHTTGVWHGTQQQLASLVGLDRKNLRPRLQRLEDVGLIGCYFPKGHAGYVVVWVYLDVVHLPPSQGANHPLHMGRFPPIRTNGHKGRNAPYEVPNRPIWPHETAGHSVAASGLLARHALVEPFALRSDTDEGVVIDIASGVRDASRPKGATPQPTTNARGRGQRPASPSVGRDTDGGGSDPTPVHPRSRNEVLTSRSTTDAVERDPRAVSP